MGRWCGLVLLAALLVGCGPTVPTTTPQAVGNPYETQRRAQVQTLLDKWAAALRAGDTGALAPLFDSRADPVFVAAQSRRAEALRQVPLTDFGFDIAEQPEIPVPSDVLDRLGASDAWYAPVTLRYAVAGVDPQPTRKPVALTVARRGNDWRLVSDAPVAGRASWRGPWDFGALTATVADRSTVLAHPDRQPFAAAVAARLPADVAAVTRFWGTDWNQSVLVIVASSDAEFDALAGSRGGSDIAAVAVADAVSGGAPVGQRVVVAAAAAERLTDTTLRVVLRHELTHVAARAVTFDGAPLWLLEGFADYVGYRESGLSFAEIAPGVRRDPPRSLPSDDAFAAGGAAVKRVYEASWSVCAFAAETFGEPALLAMYRRLAGGRFDAAALDTGLRATLGVGTDEFVSRWQAWLSAKVA